MIGFTTANRMPAGGMHRVITQQVLTEHTLGAGVPRDCGSDAGGCAELAQLCG